MSTEPSAHAVSFTSSVYDCSQSAKVSLREVKGANKILYFQDKLGERRFEKLD